MLVDFDSPEAFEEVFWRTFGESLPDDSCDGMAPPTDDVMSAFADYRALVANPRARGTGTGRALAGAVVDAARAIGYRTLCLDTLERMTEARALYESLGFVRCARYYDNPLADACYYALDLHAPERPMTP